MRIAHVSATFPPYYGGTGNVCHYNALQLARRGHEVHVLTAALPGAATYEVRDGFTVQRLRPLVRIGNAPFLPGLTRALRGFDVIHLHWPFIVGAEMVRIAALVYRTPLVLSFHNDLIGDGARAKVFSLYQSLSAQITIRVASCLCVVSLDHFQASVLRRSLDGKGPPVVEVPNGVDSNHFCPADPDDTKIRCRYAIPASARLVLFVAALDRAHHFKGLSRVLQALQHLPYNIWLLVVGDGDLRPDYQLEAAELGIADRIVFAGAIHHDALPPFFRAADMTVLASSPPESFGLVLIESLACGTPVVASDIPGVRTVVDHCSDGFLVDASNPVILAGAITKLLENDSLRRAMGQHGRTKVQTRYSGEGIGERLEAIYRQSLDVEHREGRQ